MPQAAISTSGPTYSRSIPDRSMARGMEMLPTEDTTPKTLPSISSGTSFCIRLRKLVPAKITRLPRHTKKSRKTPTNRVPRAKTPLTIKKTSPMQHTLPNKNGISRLLILRILMINAANTLPIPNEVCINPMFSAPEKPRPACEICHRPGRPVGLPTIN